MGDGFILKTDFEMVLNNFFEYKSKGFHKDNYILRFIHDNIPRDVKSITGDDYEVVGSVGKGNWSTCPTVAILDNDVTESTRYGFYLAYLFKSDMSGVYLSFSWGSNQFDNNKPNLQVAVDEIRTLLLDSNSIGIIDFNNKMNLASNRPLPKSYEKGSIIFKYYDSEDIPEENVLISDLNDYLKLYNYAKQNYDGQFKYLLKEFQQNNINQPDIGDSSENDNSQGSSDNFLEEVFISKEEYETLVNLIKYKKNIIVQGAPGVGKTFMVQKLVYSLMGENYDANRIKMVQFHQSYSYEDFVMGYRPSNEGFVLREGSFYKFCKSAELDSENDYFFIIDEINRGNLSKIFGELFMLIEADKRGEMNKIQLLYSDELFFIPKNVHIIGLMNTADRSIAMIDYALRRRFAFFDLKPGFDSYGFTKYQDELDSDKFNNIVEVMKDLNQNINDDASLGEGFRIGHSYLCNIKIEDVDEKLNYIVEYELIPLLKEYWFDDQDKIEYWSNRLRCVIDDSA